MTAVTRQFPLQPSRKGYFVLLKPRMKQVLGYFYFLVKTNSVLIYVHIYMHNCITLTHINILLAEYYQFYIYIDNKLTSSRISDPITFLPCAQPYSSNVKRLNESTKNEKGNNIPVSSCQLALPAFFSFYNFLKSSLCLPAAELSRREASDQFVKIVI